MDPTSISGNLSSANSMFANQSANASAVSVLKKSLDMQAETVATLLQPTQSAAPAQPVSSTQGLPENVGRNINITA